MTNFQVFKKVMERKVYPAGATIFREGESATTAFVVLRGDVAITTVNAQGKSIHLTDIKVGQIFGELALMQAGMNRTATASTAQGCELMLISHASLKEKLDAADPFLRFWMQYLSERVVDLSKRV
jgi:CRP/FNR family cyclic AMP-dependent transcriptional regulator